MKRLLGFLLPLSLVLSLQSAASAESISGAGLPVISTTTHVDVLGYRWIVGEVENNTGVAVEFIKLTVNAFDQTDMLIATENTYLDVDLAPGEIGPFETVFSATIPTYSRHSVSVDGAVTRPTQPNHNFTTTITSDTTSQFGSRQVVGTVTNNNLTTSKFVRVTATFRNPQGVAVDVDYTYPGLGDDSEMAPGSTRPFKLYPRFSVATAPTVSLVTESSTPASLVEVPVPTPLTPVAPPPVVSTPSEPPVGGAPSSKSETVRPDPIAAQPAATPAVNNGYRMVARDGGVFSYGGAQFRGSVAGTTLNQPIVTSTSNPAAEGYWMVASDGGVFSFGIAPFSGSTGGMKLNQPIVGVAPTAGGRGYWLVAADGGIFAFGEARFHGSMGGTLLNQPIVGMAATPSGNGYWLVARDGGIFSFGDARFFGSTGSAKLNQPIVGMSALPTGDGYRFVAADGGVFSFGAAGFFGSTGSIKLNEPIVGMKTAPSGRGYWLIARDGGVFNFGEARFEGSAGGTQLNQPIVSVN